MHVRSSAARGLAVALLLLQPVIPALAAPACFRPAEIEADAAVRFQAELMVLSDTCGDGSYEHFAAHNRRALTAYQNALIERFRRLGSTRAETAFDSYLTRLSNEASLRDGRETVAVLCHQSSAFREKADGFSETEFKRYVAERAKERQRDYRRCAD